MRIVEGHSLRELLAEQGRLSPARAIDLLVPVAAALDAAHGRGLVHRDVKPADILIEGDGAETHVYLSDFGLAQLEGEPGTAEAATCPEVSITSLPNRSQTTQPTQPSTCTRSAASCSSA